MKFIKENSIKIQIAIIGAFIATLIIKHIGGVTVAVSGLIGVAGIITVAIMVILNIIDLLYIMAGTKSKDKQDE